MPKVKTKKLHKPIARSIQHDFTNSLKSSVVEKDVENAYKDIFKRYYQTTFPSPYGSDGFIEEQQTNILDEGLRLLLEVKFQLNLTLPKERAKIAAQSIYYLKKFELDAIKLPNVIVGGDENEMFTLYAPKLYDYLKNDYDWSIAPSNAWKENPELYAKLLEDPNLNVFVFDVRSTAFDINEVFTSIDALSRQNDEFIKLRVTESNLRLVFDEFVRVVFGDKWVDTAKKLKINPQDTVAIFIQSILGNPDIYIVPTKKNTLHLVSGKEIHVNASNYDAFFSRYDRKYSVKEVDTITAIADQLIEEVERRFHGDFWTPTVWANRAIKMMDEDLGGGWRDKYVVWDPAAGTKNLTRDYKFKKLFSSTIHQSEIDMSRQYNQEATAFQYDFLNDDIDINPNSEPHNLKMPVELFEALKNNEPIIFYTNPPYAQATEQGHSSKEKVADSIVAEIMRKDNYGHASAELYTQFIYRVQMLARDFNLSNIFFFFFNKGFLASPAFGKFTDNLLDQFEFQGGFMFNAGEFQGTSSAWGIIFSNFKNKANTKPKQNKFDFSVEHINDEGSMQKIGKHTLYRVLKDENISYWLNDVKISKEKYNEGKYPRLTGGFNVSTTKNPSGYYKKGSIGFLHNNGQNVQYSDKYVNLNSSMNSADHGTSVTKDNFERACVTFAVRKSILPDASWINDKDIFKSPSEEFQKSNSWQEFVNDCVIYSLFHRSSYQTSLRNFEYNDELFDVNNEWFFMSRDQIIELAEKNNLNDIVFDARSSDERFVYKYILSNKFSNEAEDLLDIGRELVNQTFTKRFIANEEHPEWHLMTWDAGYYQSYKITTMFKDNFSEIMNEFTKKREVLETKIRKSVYKDKMI